MSKPLRRIVAVLRSTVSRVGAGHAGVLAVVGVLVFILPSASAAPLQARAATWSVPMSGIATGTGYLRATAGSSGWSVTCAQAEVKARAKRSSKVGGTGIVMLTSVLFAPVGRTCAGPYGYTVEVTVNTLPLSFNASAYDPATGMVAGRVSGISATVESSNGCVLTVSGPGGAPGEADASYNNTNAAITIEDRGHLKIGNVGAGCSVLAGEAVLLSGRLQLTPRGIITSP